MVRVTRKKKAPTLPADSAQHSARLRTGVSLDVPERKERDEATSRLSETAHDDATKERWTGQDLIAALNTAAARLAENRDRINALNVFPVPDGDTGTNMGLTVRAAIDEVKDLAGNATVTASDVAARIARGSLLGARGNSGVILSQIFRGFARGIGDRSDIGARDFAQALRDARDMAYKAVIRPVEGTMLTVIRIASDRAWEVAKSETATIRDVIGAALEGSRDALKSTPDLLEILRQAGVVDAGGQGVVYLLEGLDCFARGDTTMLGNEQAHVAVAEDMAFLDRIEDLHGEDAFGYCTNFMVLGTDINVDAARDALATMGDSAVIVGDETILKVHIHVLNPGKVLDVALAYGELVDIKIDNMQAQTRALKDRRSAASDSLLAPPQAVHDTPIGSQSVLAVASGAGLADALRSMGATQIVSGGPTMNPSTEELLAAVESARTDEVFLLPNHPNVLMAANQVAALTDRRLFVIPSKSIPQGLAALGAYNGDADFETNAARMTQAMIGVRTVMIAIAARSTELDGVSVVEGQFIGLLDGSVVASGSTELSVVTDALSDLAHEDVDLITVFAGEDVSDAEKLALQRTIEQLALGAEIEIQDGGQSHYRYIISVE